MGNSPSTSKSANTPHQHGNNHRHGYSGHGHDIGASAAQQHGHGHDSPRSNRREAKNPLPGNQHIYRSSASSPEASAVSVQGSTTTTVPPGRHGQTKPLSTFNSSPPSGSSQQAHQHSSSSSVTAATVAAGSSGRRASVSNKSGSVGSVGPGSGTGSRSGSGSGQGQGQAQIGEDETFDEPTKPLDVPIVGGSTATAGHHHDVGSSRSSHYEDAGLISNAGSSSVQDMSSYNIGRPPRLPLPIEEEIHTPGSPIIAPAEGDSTDAADVDELDKDSINGSIPRRTSGLSNATDDDETEELRIDKTRPTVPTRVTWVQGGQKVYVTGTPFQWSRKQRLYPTKGKEGELEAVIHVYPGTHHIKFLVDGSMETSTNLPTTVDFGNNLVNYIEVSGEDVPVRNLSMELPPPRNEHEFAALASRHPSSSQLGDSEKKTPQRKMIVPSETFTDDFPRYLADFDQPEDTRSYQLAVTALDKMPNPPTLPGFLTKPLLNNTTLIKDDNSVLNMPNHTILNHLCTSSIKNNILAVSATTRYRSKYVTTIIYKPTSPDS